MCSPSTVTIDFLIELAKIGGEMILDNIHNREKLIEEKGNVANIVTDTDLLVEKTLLNKILSLFPSHTIYSEEASEAHPHPPHLPSTPTWLIDPIDGTCNFVHTFPSCCVSIAYADKGEVLLAVVYNPNRSELFTAEKGKGAFLNGKSISPSLIDNVSKALVSTGFCMYTMRSLSQEGLSEEEKKRIGQVKTSVLRTLGVLMENCHDIRRIGSAALDMCYVACGRVDVYFEVGVCCWDVGAGALIAREAGCVLSATDGKDFSLFDRNVLVTASRPLQQELIQLTLKDYMKF